MLALEQVRFSWPGQSHVLLSIDEFSVGDGERVLIRGASGSGKTSLLNLLGGVMVPQQGRIRILGTPINELRSARRDRFRADHIGFIFQMFNLIPYLSLIDNVLLPCRFSHRRRQRVMGRSGGLRGEATRLLEQLGLTVMAKPVAELSVGQQQRVAAARALIGRPELIIADEPTSALDADRRQDFLELLMWELAAYGGTLVFVSHDVSLASLFDRSVALADINRVAGEG